MTDILSTHPLNSSILPILMFSLSLLFQNSPATSCHNNPFLLISPHTTCRAALPISSSSFFSKTLCSQPSSVLISLHSSQLVPYLYLDLHSPSRQHYCCCPLPVLLRWSSLEFISSLCTFLIFHSKELLLLPSSFFFIFFL